MKRTNIFFLTFLLGITSMLTAMLCACGGSGDGGGDNPYVPHIPDVKRDIQCELMASGGSWLWNRERSRAAYEAKYNDLLFPYETNTDQYDPAKMKPSIQINGWMHFTDGWVRVPFDYVKTTHPGEYHYYGVAKDKTGTCDNVFICDIPEGASVQKSETNPSLTGTEFTLTGLRDITTIEDDIMVATKANNAPTAGCINFADTIGNRNDRSCLEHIYSCLQIGFRVGTKYADLRFIHIKSVEIERNNIASYFKYTQETNDYKEGKFELLSGTNMKEHFIIPQVYIDKKDENYNKVISDQKGLILGKGESIEYPSEIKDNDNYQGKSLNGTDSQTKSGKQFLTWGRVLFAPNLYTGINPSDGFNLEIVYDVYTLHGQKTRYNVTQTMNVKRDLFRDPNNNSKSISAFAAGSYYNLLIDINPDYLYVLADDDITGHLVIKVSP